MTQNFLLHFILGFLVCLLILWLYHRFKMGSYAQFFRETLLKSEKEIEDKKHSQELELQTKKFEHQKKCDQEWNECLKKIDEEKKQLKQKQDKLQEMNLKNERLAKELGQKIDNLRQQEEELLKQREEVIGQKNRLVKSLEEISGLSSKEAEEKLFDKLSLQVKKNCALWGARYFKEKKSQIDLDATKLIAHALNRLSSGTTAQMTLSSIDLPHEDFKSKIIGREGRNITYLENILGVNLLVDETPKTVLISAVDPLRRAIAKETLEQLVQSGRIHPTKIDEEYQKAKTTIEKNILKKAEDFALQLGITDLHPYLLELLAKMELMNSLGQNLLEHSYQVAQIMGIMAAELKLNADLAKRIGLLHDIGKAAPAEIAGTHALIGQKLALKYGESDEVANGIACHHDEVIPITIEGSLCGAADAISASRPGARSENLQYHVKRLNKLEDIALSFPEVEKAYVLQAGREIRVIALPEKIDDASLTLLAQSIALKIEQQLTHPGKIKISVLRQKQVIEFTTT